MPVELSEPHELTVRDGSEPYGCHNRKMAAGYFAPARRFFPDGSFDIVSKFIAHKMSTECRYDKSLADVRCAECCHQGTGENYNAMIRNKGS